VTAEKKKKKKIQVEGEERLRERRRKEREGERRLFSFRRAVEALLRLAPYAVCMPVASGDVV
jgi:hypothetical protein